MSPSTARQAGRPDVTVPEAGAPVVTSRHFDRKFSNSSTKLMLNFFQKISRADTGPFDISLFKMQAGRYVTSH
jgi:hypothetical protein